MVEFDHTNWSVTDEDLIYIFEHMTFERIAVNLYNITKNNLSNGDFQNLVYFTRPMLTSAQLALIEGNRLQLRVDADNATAVIHKLGECALS
jgi:hypothetical protein